jgi:hypothetical protein
MLARQLLTEQGTSAPGSRAAVVGWISIYHELCEVLMIVGPVRKQVMQYRDHELSYDSENENFEVEFVRQQAGGKQYRRKRSIRATRRRATKTSSSKPGCGLGARRNHRWTW